MDLNLRPLFESCTEEQLQFARNYLLEKGGNLADILLPMIGTLIANKMTDERKPSLNEICDTVEFIAMDRLA